MANTKKTIAFTTSTVDSRGRFNLQVNGKTIARVHAHDKTIVIYTAAKTLGTDITVFEKKFTAQNTAKKIRADKVQVNAAYTTAEKNGKSERFFGKINFKVTKDTDLTEIETAIANMAKVEMPKEEETEA